MSVKPVQIFYLYKRIIDHSHNGAFKWVFIRAIMWTYSENNMVKNLAGKRQTNCWLTNMDQHQSASDRNGIWTCDLQNLCSALSPLGHANAASQKSIIITIYCMLFYVIQFTITYGILNCWNFIVGNVEGCFVLGLNSLFIFCMALTQYTIYCKLHLYKSHGSLNLYCEITLDILTWLECGHWLVNDRGHP